MDLEFRREVRAVNRGWGAIKMETLTAAVERNHGGGGKLVHSRSCISSGTLKPKAV
jgi:hypothetical protein